MKKNSNKVNNINKEHLKKKKFLKSEIKKIILKSIIQNLNIEPKIRANAQKKRLKLRTNSFISKQTGNLCSLSGRFKGVLKSTQLSRHVMKKMMTNGCLQNVKIISW